MWFYNSIIVNHVMYNHNHQFRLNENETNERQWSVYKLRNFPNCTVCPTWLMNSLWSWLVRCVFCCGTKKKIVGTNFQRNLPVDKFPPSPTILEAEVVLWRQRWAFLWLWIVDCCHLVHPLLPSRCPALCKKASAASTSGCPLKKENMKIPQSPLKKAKDWNPTIFIMSS